MVVCTYFQQGNCRNGQRCRFEHVYASRYSYNAGSSHATSVVADDKLSAQVASDAGEVLRGHMWPLTGYSPFREKGQWPDLVDVSPEECRHLYYDAARNNCTADAVNFLSRLTKEAEKKYELLLQPSETIMRSVRALYNGERPIPAPYPSIPSQAWHPAMFWSAANLTTTNNNIFKQGSSGHSVFNQAVNNTQSIFAQGVANAQFAQSSANGPSIFAQTPTNGQSLFSQAPTNGQSLFAQTPTNAQSMFAQALTSGQSLFAQAPTNGQSLFAQAPTNGQSLFAQTPTNAQSVIAQAPTSGQSLFAQAPTNGQSLFAQTPTNNGQAPTTIYSSEQQLSQSDLAEYNAHEFTLGRVPLLPPTLQQCN